MTQRGRPPRPASTRSGAKPTRSAAKPSRSASSRSGAKLTKAADPTRSGAKPTRSATIRPAAKSTRSAGHRRRAPARRSPPARPKQRRGIRLGSPARRLQFGLVTVLVLFAVIGGRLVQLQGLDGTAYAAQAERLRLRSVVLPAQRGDILDRDGNILVRTIESRTVFADPTLVVNPAGTAARLAGPLGAAQPALVGQLTKRGRYVILKRGLRPEVAKSITDLHLPGIGSQPENQREVPGHDLAANLIGFVGRDGNGMAGIESRYDEVLRGRPGMHEYQTAPGGQAMPGDLERTVPAVPGRSVQLTLDRDVQYVAQQSLSERMRQTGAYTGSAVVLDARTFQVVAMASYPTYDAADPAAAPATALGNAAVSNVVEPGSIHKVVTIAGALQAGVISPDTAMIVPPTITKGGKTFRDTHMHGTVPITLMGILAQSSNVGTIEIADKLGAQGVYDAQRRFGLGAKTGLDFPGESPGIVQPPANWSGPSAGGIPIGLGVAVTPLQMAVVYATIANDGLRLEPSLVRGFRNADGTFAPAHRPKATRVISPAVAAVMRTDLSAITSKHATGKKAAIGGYVIAGKTGTGQRVENGRYTQGNVTSFIGMAPAADPKYVVAVFVHAPNGVGGAVSAPVFRDLMGYVLRHFRVPPQGQAPPELFLGARQPAARPGG